MQHRRDPMSRPSIVSATLLFLGLSIVVFSLTAPAKNLTAQPPAPSAGSEADPPRVLTPEESLRQDAQAYAGMHNVGEQEALRRLRIEEKMGDTVARLREQHRERFAGIYLQHEPQFRLVVRLTADRPVKPEVAQLAGSELPIAFEHGASATQEQVLQSIQSNLPAFKAAFPGLQGTEVDDATGEIVLTVHASGAAREQARAQVPEVAATAGQPVRVRFVDQPVELQQIRGGGNTSTCTTGFVVKNSAGTTGVTTAAHCNNSQSYTTFGGTSYTMTYQSEINDADQDVQWHTTAQTEHPEFYADLTTTARILTGRRLRSSTAAGNTTCHRGRTSAYSCGSVASTTYQPTSYTCGTQTCAATWISVTGSSLACAPGDSGGPWFNGQTAFGTHAAGGSSGSGPGQCSVAIYMSTDYLSGLGVSLLYG